MQIPQLNGKLSYSDFFIFAACDEHYFDDFAPALINSIKFNTDHKIHLHVFNPRQDQLDFCSQNRVSVSFESVPLELFGEAASKWNIEYADEPLKSQKLRTLTAMTKGKDINIQDRMRKTYYACSRFIRLQQLLEEQDFFAIDIDALVRKPVENLKNKDFYIYHISGAKARFLAGGIYGSVRSKTFLKDYSDELRKYLQADYIYWGLDQDVLDNIVPKYSWSKLPDSYIDWNMRPNSAVWTAKGTRKDLAVFLNEKKKYIS
jgi:hypothetical protein